MRIGNWSPVVALEADGIPQKVPFAVDMVNTGMVDGAVTALSRMSRRRRSCALTVCGDYGEQGSPG